MNNYNSNNIPDEYFKEFREIREGILQGERTWDDVVNLRYRYNRPELSRDTIRKGVLFYDEFNDAGLIDVHGNEKVGSKDYDSVEDLVAKTYVDAKVIREFKDGNYTSDRLVSLNDEDLNNPRAIMQSHGFNPDEYDLISARSSKWQQGKGDGVKNLYSSRITVKPKEIPTDKEWYENLLNNIAVKHDNTKSVYYSNYSKTGEMLVVALDDLHWGREAWIEETGEEYNRDIARKRILDNVSKIVTKFRDRKFENITLKMGSDFLNSNYDGVTTLHKNPQDNDGGFKRIFSSGIELLIEVIDMFHDLAPVNVVWVSGNHGEKEDYFLSKCIEMYYMNIDGVDVDATAFPRKYRKFGTNLIGFMHGDKEKKETIPNLMACEAPAYWSNTSEHVFITGHLHNVRERTFEENGVTVFTVPTLISNDIWTKSKGYNARKRTMCFIFDRENGLVETHYFNIK